MTAKRRRARLRKALRRRRFVTLRHGVFVSSHDVVTWHEIPRG